MSTLDAVKNFSIAEASTGYSNVAVTVTLATGFGSRFPVPQTDGAFNLVWWDSSTYSSPSDDPNVEIVRCTARTGDILTISRSQEGTLASAKNVAGKTYKLMLAPTAKLITDIQTAVDSKIASSEKGAALGVATLDATGKVFTTQLPALAITETYVVSSQAQMLALVAQRGDVAIRTDLNKSFILATDSPATLADWKELLTPTDSVLSVNGMTGSVVITTSDIPDFASTLDAYWKTDGSSGAATGNWYMNHYLLLDVGVVGLFDSYTSGIGTLSLYSGAYYLNDSYSNPANVYGYSFYAGQNSGAGFYGGQQTSGSGGYFTYSHVNGGYDSFTVASYDPLDEWGVAGGVYLSMNPEEGWRFVDGSGTGFTAASGQAGIYLGGYTIVRGDAGGLYVGTPSLGLGLDLDCPYIYSNGYHYFEQGSVTNPSLAFQGATNYGTWYNSGFVNFSAAGALTMRYSTAGLAIGGTFPINAKLHIASTTEQFRSGYTSAIYWNAITNSVGLTTFAATGGTTPKFAFSSSINLRAGTAAVDTYPLMFTSGALLTSPVVGVQEFLTDKFYGTITTGAARKEYTMNDAALTSGRVPYTTTNGRLLDSSNLAYVAGGALTVSCADGSGTDSLIVRDARGDIFSVKTNQNNIALNSTTLAADANSSQTWNIGKGAGIGTLAINYNAGASNIMQMGIDGANNFYMTGAGGRIFNFGVGNSATFNISTQASSNINIVAGNTSGTGNVSMLGTGSGAAGTAGFTTTGGVTLSFITGGVTNATMDSAGTFSHLGDIKITAVGKGIYIKEGSNATMGTATMIGGTVTVATTKVTATSRIYLAVQSLGTVAVATPVAVTDRVAGTSFTISSSAITDTSVIAWWIVEPA